MAKNLPTNYKFKEIRFYCSDEWMAGSTKRYRKVFERNEVRYIWAEFSFYNKLFDEETWKADFILKAFSLNGNDKKELCSLDSSRTIEVDENIVYVRDGWGNTEPGAFWFKGDYCWEAYINGALVGSEKFYIEDCGRVTPGSNPYFDIESVKLFESDFDYPDEAGRKYLRKFKRDTTRYVWTELNIIHKTNEDYFNEVFFNFYDDAGMLKAQTSWFEYVKKGQSGQKLPISVGWGNKTPGSWKDDKYMLEVVFMDTLLAAVTFEVGDEETEGLVEPVKAISPDQVVSVVARKEAEKEKTLEEIIADIDQLIGLQEIKKEIKQHVSYLNYIKIRKEKGLQDSEKISLHSVFTGNPGTGKTTIVRMLGMLYKQMGLLTKGHVVEAGRGELVGEYIGQTAPKVKNLIKEARGGILFIDEAYSLVRDKNDTKDFGREVVETLLKEMSDGEGNIAVMAAGYPKEMQVFLDSNPGLKSRFSHYFHFDDYTPEELLQIADYACTKRGVVFTGEAHDFIRKKLIDVYRDRDQAFGNARYAYSLVDESKIHLGIRLMGHPDIKNLSEETLSTIELQDVEMAFMHHKKKVADIPVDEPLLRSSLDELNNLTGMKNVKDEISDLVKLIRYYREIGKDVLNKFSLHIVFTGNPGTGKTTVARITGKIFKALGLLERGHLVECDREALVAGYVGQTAIKTNEMIESARNGVLFIDEAYSLAAKGESDFGQEAVEVILKRMEDLKGEISVIAAGYPDNMRIFLESNPGLKSRFNQTLNFEDYNPDDLFSIALNMLKKENLTPDAAASDHLRKYFSLAFSARDKFFGNARFIRNTVEEAVKNQNLRMAGLSKEERSKQMIETLTLDDVKCFEANEQKTTGRIGFKQ